MIKTLRRRSPLRPQSTVKNSYFGLISAEKIPAKPILYCILVRRTITTCVTISCYTSEIMSLGENIKLMRNRSFDASLPVICVQSRHSHRTAFVCFLIENTV